MKTKLTKRQREAARLLSEGASEWEAARQVGCSLTTLQGWMRDAQFMEWYQEGVLRTKVMSYARAVQSVQRMMGDENPSVAQRAVHEALDQFEDAASQLGGRQVVVRVEGGPVIGMPGQEEDADG